MDAPPNETIAGVVQRLEAALGRMLRADAGAKPILALDADGTLWTGDTGLDLFTSLLAAGSVLETAGPALAVEAEAAGATPGPTALATAHALFEAFLADRYAEDRAFAMMAWAFAGWKEADMDAFAARVAVEQGLAGRLRASVVRVVEWAREHGVETLLVSASPRAIVVVGAALVGIGASSVLAMTPAIEDGRLLARLAEPATYGEGKVRAIRASRPDAMLLGAFGDGGWDAEMLREAMVPVAVAPSSKLLARAADVPGLVVLPE